MLKGKIISVERIPKRHYWRVITLDGDKRLGHAVYDLNDYPEVLKYLKGVKDA